MHFSLMDAYFHMAAKGDREAFENLYFWVEKVINSEIKKLVKELTNFIIFPGEIQEFLHEIFCHFINEFDPQKCTAFTYLHRLFKWRLSFKVKDEIIQYHENVIHFRSGDFATIEPSLYVGDSNQHSMSSEITLNDFIYQISSPNKHRNLYKRKRDKILYLQYSGYNQNEICDKLQITKSQLRTLLKNIENDEEINNLKIDLK